MIEKCILMYKVHRHKKAIIKINAVSQVCLKSTRISRKECVINCVAHFRLLKFDFNPSMLKQNFRVIISTTHGLKRDLHI